MTNGEGKMTPYKEVKHKVCMVVICKWVYIFDICNGLVICWEFSKAFEILVLPKMKCCKYAYMCCRG